jgi:hypothetical protein
MTTFAPKALGDGELPNVQAVIFTATADVGTYVKSFSLYNKNAATQTITLWIKRAAGSGTERVWKRYELLVNEWAEVIDEDTQSIELAEGDEIQAQTTTANAVDFDIAGVTEVN